MSKLSHAQPEAINPEEYHAIEEQVPELFEAIKQLKPAINNSYKAGFESKAASFVKALQAEKEAIDLKEYHRQANEALLPALAEAIMKLRPVLSHFRDHEFVGVPKVRKLTVHEQMRTKWVTDERHEALSKLELDDPCEQMWALGERHKTSFSNIKLIGRWLEKSGFKAGEYMQVLALNGLLIICPESFPDDRESKAVIESKILFGKVAV